MVLRGSDFLPNDQIAPSLPCGNLCPEAWETSSDGTLFIDSAGVVKAFDHKFESLTGGPVTSEAVRALFPLPCSPFDLLAAGESQSVRYGTISPFGQPRVPARIEYMRVSGGLLTMLRFNRELESGREESLVGAILEATGSVIVVLDPDGRFVRFNRGAERLTSFSEEEVLGRRFWDIVLFDEDAPSGRAAFHELIAGVGPSVRENRWKTRDGSARILRWSYTLTRNWAGKVEHIVATGIDLTEIRETERALDALSREFLEAQSAARRNVSQFLHDTVSQQLVVLSLSLSRIRNASDSGQTPEWGRAFELVDRCCRDLRVISYALAPPVFDDTGLAAAFDWYAGHLREDAGVNVELLCDAVPENLAPGVQAVLFAALQEWAGKIIRSPKAARTVISLRGHGDGVELKFICDDPASDVVMGICTSPVIRERIRALGGSSAMVAEEHGLSARILLPGIRR